MVFKITEYETMSAVKKQTLVSEQDYLAGELGSPVRHEYLGGYIHAMAGSSNRHSIIEANFMISLGTKLNGQPCRPFSSNAKIRITLPNQIRFYYPDVSVICRQNPQTDSFQESPVVIVEILSHSTRRTDTGEKLRDYLTLPSLLVYLLVEQEEPVVVAHRRSAEGFVREVYAGMQTVIPLPEVGINLTLSEIYNQVEFAPEHHPDDSNSNDS